MCQEPRIQPRRHHEARNQPKKRSGSQNPVGNARKPPPRIILPSRSPYLRTIWHLWPLSTYPKFTTPRISDPILNQGP